MTEEPEKHTYTPEEFEKRLMEERERIFKELDTEEALSHIGQLIDLSLDMNKIEGLRHAIKLSEELQTRHLTPGQLSTSYYFLANAWAGLRKLSRMGSDLEWGWEQKEIEREIVCLRRALSGIKELPDERVCQILTNLGNLMSEIGRFVEAIEYWYRALAKILSFPMARGNRGYGLSQYATALYDQGHIGLFLKYAHTDLNTAISLELHEGARKSFDDRLKWIEKFLSPEFIDKDIDIHGFSLGVSEQEILYREWCLENRLFLSPLNDLGPYPIAACDVITTPSIVAGIDEGPHYQGYFNQMKQEFTSARYMYYEGINSKKPHFSDRDVLLYDTLDYPSYSLSTEKVKAAFRIVYSLFDKIAYFLNEYLNLSIPQRNVTFRTL